VFLTRQCIVAINLSKTDPILIWNKTIYSFLKSQKLSGNFRDFQKLASYIIAFNYELKNTDVAIEKAINEFKKWESKSIKKKDNYFTINKTYNEIIAKFNKNLANWAIKKYGNKANAAKVLSRSESMISKDLKQHRLNK